MTQAAIGLLGSGEFEPWAEQVDRWLLERATPGNGRVLLLPTACAPEGQAVWDRWARMGLAHYARLGVEAEVVPLKTRQDASRPELARLLDDASLAFFSGGNPAYLATTLLGTPFWTALLQALGRGMAYGGCSAGIACLGELAPDSAVRSLVPERWRPGLRLFPGVLFGPHWDAMQVRRPELKQFLLSALPDGGLLVGVDERTALVGDGSEWTVMGVGGVHVYQDGAWRQLRAGEPLGAALASLELSRG